MDYAALLSRIDALYEGVVTHPEAWDDSILAEWADEAGGAGGDPVPRPAAREVRRCLRSARRLRDFWLDGSGAGAVDGDDWRTRVDVALGGRAWRPTLSLAQMGLQESPSPELFDEVKARFRVVNSERWMDGIDYDAWLETYR